MKFEPTFVFNETEFLVCTFECTFQAFGLPATRYGYRTDLLFAQRRYRQDDKYIPTTCSGSLRLRRPEEARRIAALSRACASPSIG